MMLDWMPLVCIVEQTVSRRSDKKRTDNVEYQSGRPPPFQMVRDGPEEDEVPFTQPSHPSYS